jgi:hypothetical protein
MISKRFGIALGAALAVCAGGVYYYRTFLVEAPADGISPLASALPATPAAGDVGKAIESLPPTAIGAAADAPATLGGTTAKGRVERIYVRVRDGVLIDLAMAKGEEREGWRYASIEFPDVLANGATAARVLVPRANENDVVAGDIVEVKFAHQDVKTPFGSSFFKVIERDRVAEVVAKADTPVAQEFQQRIAARARSAGQSQLAGAALWKALPLEHAVKIVRGGGTREMAVFSDPNCPACVEFEKTMQQVDDVTLYVFMFPAIRPDKAGQSKSVWCSPDRGKAWTDLALNRKAPEAAPTCENPVDAILALRQPIGIRVTPTIVFSNGERGQGSLLPVEVRDYLARAQISKTAAR